MEKEYNRYLEFANRLDEPDYNFHVEDLNENVVRSMTIEEFNDRLIQDEKFKNLWFEKKPDNVADNPGLLPYGSNVGAPAIRMENVDAWKQANAQKVNKQFQVKFEELKEEYQKLIEEFKWNELVYSAKYNFEPIIGESYHLYYNKNGDIFLSLIAPNEWKYDFIGTFKMESNNKWNKI